MSRLVLINRALLVLLGVATGAVKLAQMPDEMRIFLAAGFSVGMIIAFGAVQIVAALAVLPSKTRRMGAAVLGLTFAVATGVLFVNSMMVFGVVSLLFIAMAAVAFAKDQP